MPCGLFFLLLFPKNNFIKIHQIFDMEKMPMITILGPTASGKTELAAHLAREINAEIISADSRQVYRRMDIGTGKDLADYCVDGVNIPYHLIDIMEPGTKYNLFEYQRDFLDAYSEVCSREKNVILCGGTGLYIESVLKGYRLIPVPENEALRKSLEGKTLEELTQILEELKKENKSVMHNTTDVDTAKRAIRAIEIETAYRDAPVEEREFPKIDTVIIGVEIDRELRREKISRRLRQRLDSGMIEEVKSLLDSGIPAENLIYYGLEYKFVTEYLTGKLSYDEMVRTLEIAIHQFAKRQMTWFRGMERRGFSINWIKAQDSMDEKIKAIRNIIKSYMDKKQEG